ncbi:MAG: hypothetical protein R3B06_15480 [Kofleriaceae bacterium]
MGFLDKIKQAVSKVPLTMPGAAPASTNAAPHHAPADEATYQAAPEPAPEPAFAGPSFTYDGDRYPLPTGWDDLSMDDWFFKFETLRDRMRFIDKEDLPAMTDADGDRLDPEEVLLITQFGFTSGGHYEKYRRWSVENWARHTGESPTDCEFRLGAIARERLTKVKAEAMSGAGGPLSPVEGVTSEQWARLQAQLASGADAATLIAGAGIDDARWARVSAEWNRRMSSDQTATVATVYANAFATGAGGPYGGAAAQAASAGYAGDVGAPPVPFELFVEVAEAMRAAGLQGRDPTQLLASFKLRPIDWSNIGAYWNRKIAQEATTYHNRYSELSAHFAAKYGSA